MQTPTELTTALVARGAAGSWELDPGGSSVGFSTALLGGLMPVRGRFENVAGLVEIAPSGTVSGIVVVEAASVDTRVERRDKHLRSADFFDVDSTPRIEFAVDGILPIDLGAAVTGTLTIRGVARPLRIDMTASVTGDAAVCLDGTAALDRREFGIVWNILGMASNTVTVSVHALFRERDADTSIAADAGNSPTARP